LTLFDGPSEEEKRREAEAALTQHLENRRIEAERAQDTQLAARWEALQRERAPVARTPRWAYISLALLSVLVLVLVVRRPSDPAARVLDRFASGASSVRVTDRGAKFTARFPLRPVHTSVSSSLGGKPVPVSSYTCDLGAEAFSIVVADYRGRSLDRTSLLESSVRGVVRGTGGHLERSSYTTFRGREALDFVVRMPIGYIHGRQVMTGGRFYQLQGTSVKKEPAGYSRFLDSFSFLR